MKFTPYRFSVTNKYMENKMRRKTLLGKRFCNDWALDSLRHQYQGQPKQPKREDPK